METILDCTEGIRVSLDATNKDDYIKIHRPKSVLHSYDKVISNIKFLVKNKRKKDFLIGINFCFYENYRNAKEAVKLGKKLKVDYIGIRKVLYTERFFGIQKFSDEEIYKEFLKAKKMGEKFGITVFIDSFHGQEITQKFQNSECLANPLSAVVCANKHVYPCCALRYVDEFDFGEIKGSFLKVWKGEQRKKVLEKISKLKCLKFCGFRYNYYNDVLKYLRLKHKPHGEFI